MNRIFSGALNLLNNAVAQNNVNVMATRGKKVLLSGSTRNRRSNAKGKYRRLYVQDGEWVEEDHLLVRQLGLQFYPGENVVFCANHTLKARLAGHVVITLEKLSPYPSSPLHQYVANGNVVERKFVHVIAPKREGNYKLVDTI